MSVVNNVTYFKIDDLDFPDQGTVNGEFRMLDLLLDKLFDDEKVIALVPIQTNGTTTGLLLVTKYSSPY